MTTGKKFKEKKRINFLGHQTKKIMFMFYMENGFHLSYYTLYTIDTNVLYFTVTNTHFIHLINSNDKLNLYLKNEKSIFWKVIVVMQMKHLLYLK